MAKLRLFSLLIASLALSSSAAPGTPPHPLRQTELLALVAGNALPENIVNEIRARGVAFRPDDSFRTQLTNAGAAPSILAALDGAKAPVQDTAEDKSDPALVQHIAAAAKLMNEKHYDEAADELTATLKGNFEKFEIGFVMGELLRQQERWAEAAAVYTEVLNESSDFPDARTHLSYALHRIGEFDAALREAKAALARTPENAEAHRCAGIALADLRKYDASEAEFHEALRIKPDFALVHYDLGVTFYEKGDKANAIAEYRKTLALDARHINARYNLANTLDELRNFDDAIREFREAKRLAPSRFDIRMNLSTALIDANLIPQAVVELRELEVMAPNSAMCHTALGNALYMKPDLKEAEKEYRTAANLDPSDPEIRLSLGTIYEDQKQYDSALEEYRRAEELDENSSHAHRNIGRVLLAMKQVQAALKELKQAADLAPGEAPIHDYYGQALRLSGDLDTAVSEFRESLNLDSKQVDVRLSLAAALEKKGDWVAALDQYHRASIDDDLDPLTRGFNVPFRSYDAVQKYKEAQERFSQHLTSLKEAGKASEAAELQKTLRDTRSSAKASDKLDALMQMGWQAVTGQRYDEAESNYRQALQIAETLRPPDARLVSVLGHLGNMAASRKDFTAAGAFFERQLKVAEEISGPQNPMAVTLPLRLLAMNALAQKDFASAKKFVQRALDANKKFYGDNSAGYADVLPVMASVYRSQEDYEHAEPYLVQAVDIEKKLYEYDPSYSGMGMNKLWNLCAFYEEWGKPEKLESCDRRLIPVLEKLGGPDTHFLEASLTRQAKTLRTLGRPDEADKIEQRLKSLQPSAANNPH